MTGSGNLIRTLLEDDLVDLFGLWTSRSSGSGKRLFVAAHCPAALKLTDSFTPDTV